MFRVNKNYRVFIMLHIFTKIKDILKIKLNLYNTYTNISVIDCVN